MKPAANDQQDIEIGAYMLQSTRISLKNARRDGTGVYSRWFGEVP